MPPGGRQEGQEGDGTDKNVLRVGDANGDDGGEGSEKDGKGTQTAGEGASLGLEQGLAGWGDGGLEFIVVGCVDGDCCLLLPSSLLRCLLLLGRVGSLGLILSSSVVSIRALQALGLAAAAWMLGIAAEGCWRCSKIFFAFDVIFCEVRARNRKVKM